MVGSRRLEDILRLAIGVVVLILLNLLATRYFHRFDLTEEGRYSIKPATEAMLEALDDVVYIEVYLDGELNSDFKRLRRSIKETLDEFQVYAGRKVQYVFNDPSAALTDKARGEFMQDLMAKGIQPTNIIDNRDGQRVEKLIFPGAVISYGGVEQGVMLLKGNKATSPQEKINQSIEGLEFELASAIRALTSIERKKIAVISGHEELSSLQMASLLNALDQSYQTERVSLLEVNDNYAALLIAKPQTAFTEREKYALDQYLMHGGKVVMLLDRLKVQMDSASRESNYSLPYELNLEDQLFKYGLRINQNLIQDLSASGYPVNVGNMGDQSQIKMLKWWFYPVLNRFSDHPITRHMDAALGRFMSSIDTVKAAGVTKTPLIFTSDYSRTMTAPVNVSLQDLRKQLTPELMNKKNLPVGYLLEGNFQSLYKNRFKPPGVNEATFKSDAADEAKLLLISDGDFARNDINPRTGNPQALGFDPFTQQQYANQDLLLNAFYYLTDEGGIITARNKEVKIRPLDKVEINSNKLKWQLINLLLPVILLVTYGVARYFFRKRKYANLNHDKDAA